MKDQISHLPRERENNYVKGITGKTGVKTFTPPKTGIDPIPSSFQKQQDSQSFENEKSSPDTIQRKPVKAEETQKIPEAGTGRKIQSDKPTSVKTGTTINYSLQQLGPELWPADKELSYQWTAFNDHNTKFIDKVSPYESLQCSSINPGNYTIAVQILNKGVPVPGCYYTYQQNVYMEKLNTELGGLSVGNFDFTFDGKNIDVSVKVKFQFEDSIAEANQNTFKSKFFNAIRTYWGSHGRVLEATTDSGSIFDIPIHINCTEVSDSSYHKVVDVTKDRRRSKVIDEINVYEGVSSETIAHEFGHVLGLDDEYDGGWMENIMFWHDDGSHQADTNALMNSGGEMRDRYFMLYKKAVESTAPTGYSYKIK